MTKRIYDNNGFFEIEKNPISKVGVFPYLGASIGAPDADKIYNVYRPAEELSSIETINSFKLQPFVDDHTMLGEGETPAEQKGIQGTIGEKVIFEVDTLYSNLKVWSDAFENLIEGGKKELSCGYRCAYEFVEGVYDGQKYDAIQRNIRGNHIALVDEGRMGKEVRVLDHMKITFDSKDLKETNMDEKQLEALIAKSLTPVMDKMEEMGKDMDLVKKKSKDMEEKVEDMEEKAADAEKEEGMDADKDYKKMYDEMKPKFDKMAKDMEEMKSKSKGMDEALKTAEDQAIKKYQDKLSLVDSLSKHVGTFDHSEMDFNGVVKYGCDKLELTPPDGQEYGTLIGCIVAQDKKTLIVGSGQDGVKTGPLTSYDAFK